MGAESGKVIPKKIVREVCMDMCVLGGNKTCITNSRNDNLEVKVMVDSALYCL